jgi:hypothetical protein
MDAKQEKLDMIILPGIQHLCLLYRTEYAFEQVSHSTAFFIVLVMERGTMIASLLPMLHPKDLSLC